MLAEILSPAHHLFLPQQSHKYEVANYAIHYIGTTNFVMLKNKKKVKASISAETKKHRSASLHYADQIAAFSA